jgi:hypothetical protein
MRIRARQEDDVELLADQRADVRPGLERRRIGFLRAQEIGERERLSARRHPASAKAIAPTKAVATMRRPARSMIALKFVGRRSTVAD